MRKNEGRPGRHRMSGGNPGPRGAVGITVRSGGPRLSGPSTFQFQLCYLGFLIHPSCTGVTVPTPSPKVHLSTEAKGAWARLRLRALPTPAMQAQLPRHRQPDPLNSSLF
jgi:hypothetical protein